MGVQRQREREDLARLQGRDLKAAEREQGRLWDEVAAKRAEPLARLGPAAGGRA